MRMLSLAVAAALWAASGASAQGRPVVIVYGYGDELSKVADLPSGAPPGLAVGYYYQTFFLGGPKATFWTFDGQYVLYSENQYAPVTDQQLAALLGPERAASLGKPWAYRLPPGLAVTGAIIAAAVVAGYRSAQSRAARRLKDARYREAVQVYSDALPTDRELTREDRRAALAKAVAFLWEPHAVPATEAERELRLTVGEIERANSYEFRNLGAANEQAGEWAAAADCYRAAAAMMAEWDEKDHAFLLTCVERVEKQAARAGGAGAG